MLHNEARELLVEGYEATHDAEGIKSILSPDALHAQQRNRPARKDMDGCLSWWKGQTAQPLRSKVSP